MSPPTAVYRKRLNSGERHLGADDPDVTLGGRGGPQVVGGGLFQGPGGHLGGGRGGLRVAHACQGITLYSSGQSLSRCLDCPTADHGPAGGPAPVTARPAAPPAEHRLPGSGADPAPVTPPYGP